MFGENASEPDSIINATYTIDDQEPIVFNIVGESTDLLNQMFFESGQLSPGQHKLVVTYLGTGSLNNDTADTPESLLSFSYFVQQNLNAPSSSSSNTSSPSTSSVPSSSSSNPPGSSSSSDSSPGKPTEAIIGGVIGGLILVSLLISLFFFLRRHNNRRSNTHAVNVVNPSDVPNPTSTFLPQSYTSNRQSLPTQSMSNRFSHLNQPSDFANTSNSGGIPPSTPLQRQFSSPKVVRLSPSSPHLPLIGSQTNHDAATIRVPVATTEPSIQRSTSPQGATGRFIRHEDSGVRIPSDEEDVVELPPLYTPG